MSYKYGEQKKELFTDAGSRGFLKVRTRCQNLLAIAGSFTMAAAIADFDFADTWFLMACVDRMVELGEVREVPTNGFAQCRVFVKP